MPRALKELEPESSPRNSKRPRVLVACQRCKTRRQKCDNTSPACSNCASAHVACTYAETAYPSSYVKMLEERVGTLESQLRRCQPTQPFDHLHHPDNGRSSWPPAAPPQQQHHEAEPLPAARTSSGHLASGLGLLSSIAAAEPHYFGFSSGLSLAYFVQAAIDSGSTTSAEYSLPSLADRPFANQMSTSRTPFAPLPASGVGARFIRAYLSIVHPLYPFLDRKMLWNLHRRATHKEQVGPTADEQLDLTLLHLVYAIGSRCLQLLNSSKVEKDIPERHYVSAMKTIPEAIKFSSIRSIEITLLLALHSMRSPSGTSVWHLCGLAMRQCLELGLHKRRAVEDHQIRADQSRRRLFWSVYIFERKTALVLGRPFGIADEEIDADIPLNVNDDEGDSAVLSAIRSGQPTSDPCPKWSSLSLHRHHILLYHIHTRIRFTLHRLKNPTSSRQVLPLEVEVSQLFQELDQWKDQFCREISLGDVPGSDFASHYDDPEDHSDRSSESDTDRTIRLRHSRDTEQYELLLEFHKARRSLLQPLMTEATPETYAFGPSDYAACADSSGQICQIYRRLHRLSPVPFTLRDLHAVFVAGFTLIYCFCVRAELYNAQRAGHLGACSTVLYVITEQWPSARKYRDAFESVVERMVERIGCRTEPELSTPPPPPPPPPGMERRQQGYYPIQNSSRGGDHGPRRQPETSTRDLPRPVQRSSAPNTDGTVDSSIQSQSPITAFEHVSNRQDHSSQHSNQHRPSSTVDGSGIGTSADMATTLSGPNFDFGEIGGLLTDEGMDWFTGAVLMM